MVSAPAISANTDLSRWLNGRSLDDAYAEFDDQGYVIFDNVMSPDTVEAVKTAVAPYMGQTGRNDFEGFQSNRVYALLAKSPDLFSDMITHPLVMNFAQRDLGYSCRLSALLAINLLPGETVQGWHHDDGHITLPMPRQSFGVSAFWAIDETTEENGATELIPGSHKWTQAEIDALGSVEKSIRGQEPDSASEPYNRQDSVKAIMPAGSLMLAKGTLMHRGGANRSGRPRMIVTPQYSIGWARQLENMVISIPPDIVASLPKRTRELIGYNIHGAFMGYVDGMHPDRKLGL